MFFFQCFTKISDFVILIILIFFSYGIFCLYLIVGNVPFVIFIFAVLENSEIFEACRNDDVEKLKGLSRMYPNFQFPNKIIRSASHITSLHNSVKCSQYLLSQRKCIYLLMSNGINNSCIRFT